ncbi:FKBP-type peptidyl-prolyl cis-trans isomerase [Geoalkalibacter sp.]|uniref:FKBP-type peptidyl-prolyl cis-trans isomerase n=1 Tax=Geoalkalibacter sp. TaxID=3041440 RepID=UPI00272DF778|nr:peptidylprolyl isomerase [Geoalkalibacter sp.]
MIRADQGDIVKVQYTGRLGDGTVFDASPPERPLQFIIGRGEVISGFDQAIVGMYQGGRKTVTIAPEQAYGAHRADLVEEVKRSLLPDNLPLEVGRQLEVTSAEGNRFVVLVTALGEDSVTLDANHPLAGRELVFDIELLGVEKVKAELPGF